ncbi:MAG: hypothetical protein K1X89_27490 [Myxococcaceae bacterium]|nr:hypothetical protein [Myxococcaceae bacterium]
MLAPTLLAALAVAAAPKIAAVPFNVVDLSSDRATFYTEHFGDRLVDQGVEVVTPREMGALLGLERQKQLVGCSEENSSCVTELANALGVEGLLLGDIVKLPAGFQLNLKIISASSGKRLAAFSSQVADEGALISTLTQAARPMAEQLSRALGRTLSPMAVVATEPPVATAAASGGARRWWWVPAAVGGLALVGGVVGLAGAERSRVTLENDRLDAQTASGVLSTGQTARTLGFVGVGVAGLAAAATGVLLLGTSAPVSPVAAVTPGGGMVGVRGSLP